MVKKMILVFICLLIFLFAFLLRSKFLFSGDFYFLSDQARDLLLVRDMVENHKPPLIGARAGLGGLFHGPLWIWFLSLPFIFFKGNPFYIAYTYIFISLLIVLAVFIVGKILYGWRGAIFASTVVTFSPTLINIVPLTTNAQIMPLIFTLFLLFLILYFRGNKKAFFLSAFFAGLRFHFQQAFSILLFPYLITTSLLKDKFILSIKNSILAFFSFLLPLSTFILFDIKHKFLISSSVLRLFTDPKSLEPMRGYEKYSNVPFRIGDRLNELTNIFSGLISPSNKSMYELLIVVFLISSALLLASNNHKLKTEFLLILFLPIFIYSAYIIHPYPIWEHYVYSIPIIASFLLVLPLINFSRYKIGKAIIFIFYILLIKPIIYPFNLATYFQKNYLKNEGSYLSQLKVVDYVFKDSKKQKFGYFVYTPQILTYGMDYLFWWRGKYKYEYIPQSEKSDPYYLIMYPPMKNDDNAHKFWIKNRIRTKNQAVSKMFIDNIVVEKMIPEKNEAPVDPNYYLNIR